jgi:hypothetical protein
MTFTRNDVLIQGQTAYILMTDRKHKVVAEAAVDIHDLERCLAYGRWCRHRNKHATYAKCARGDRANNSRVYLHRLIIGLHGPQVDHVDQDGLNCRRSNLRHVNTSQNMQNVHDACSHSKSGVRGVSWDTRDQRWRVYVRAAPFRYALGSFVNLSDAIEAARRGRIRYQSHSPENSLPVP